jgi:hypothetical protein
VDAAVLVLNADLGPLHRVGLRHAIRMLVRQVAVVHEADPGRIIGPWLAPRVLVTGRGTLPARHCRGRGDRPRRCPVRPLRCPGDHCGPHHFARPTAGSTLRRRL